MSEGQQPAEQLAQRPGRESQMEAQPENEARRYRAAAKLEGRVALVTGGDSGIGRAIAVMFAKEGADLAVGYLDEHEDAQETKRLVDVEGRRCVLLPGDIGEESVCAELVERTTSQLGRLDILVNNAAEQHPQQSIEAITAEQLERTFRTNIFSQFFLAKAALRHLGAGSSIINNTSVTAYKGSAQLLDYSSTKGAIVAFTRSLSQQLAERGIRVNAVAPGPIWTPLIPSTFPPDKVESFGRDTPLRRPGQPDEVATAFVFLASDDSSYVTGQVIHVNGGEIVNG